MITIKQQHVDVVKRVARLASNKSEPISGRAQPHEERQCVIFDQENAVSSDGYIGSFARHYATVSEPFCVEARALISALQGKGNKLVDLPDEHSDKRAWRMRVPQFVVGLHMITKDGGRGIAIPRRVALAELKALDRVHVMYHGNPIRKDMFERMLKACRSEQVESFWGPLFVAMHDPATDLRIVGKLTDTRRNIRTHRMV